MCSGRQVFGAIFPLSKATFTAVTAAKMDENAVHSCSGGNTSPSTQTLLKPLE